MQRSGSLLLFAMASILVTSTAGAGEGAPNFSRYARHGADVWARNPVAVISGEGRACVSRHTSVPYALVEPLIPGEHVAFDELIETVDWRIDGWDDNTPWYADTKLIEAEVLGGLPPGTLGEFLDGPGSRGVDAILDTVIRAMRDAYERRPASRETRAAFQHLWAKRISEGPKAGLWACLATRVHRDGAAPWRPAAAGFQ